MNKQFKRFWHNVSKFSRRFQRSYRRWDPVCGMQATAELFTSTYRGGQYFFCSAHCQSEFEADPIRYVS